MEEKKEIFTYTYSAKEREEIKRIRDKYAPPTKEETSMEKLAVLCAVQNGKPVQISVWSALTPCILRIILLELS